jgi:hypothetical protein
MPVATRCEFPGCGTLTVGAYCVAHEDRTEPRSFPRGRPFAPAQERPVRALRLGAGSTAAPVGNGEPLFYLWLRACRGFRVLGPSGRVGVVEGVARGLVNEVTGVRIRHGLFRRRLTLVLLDHIDSIAPARRSVVVRMPEPVPLRVAAQRRPVRR